VAAVIGVTIEDADGRVVSHCTGPAPDGSCPIAGAGNAVPCAGRVVRPAGVGRAGWEMRVSPVARECPMHTRRVWAKQTGHRWGPSATTD